MKAVRWHGRRLVSVDDVEMPELGAGELLVAVDACGICGTDVEEYRDGPVFVDLNVAAAESARVLGHEFSGRVVAAAPEHRARVGELVAVSPDFPCGDCTRCTSDRGACVRPVALGLNRDGGLAEMCRVPAHAAVTIPEHVGPVAAALVEPLAIARHALRAVAMHQADRVVIVGGGSIGILAALAARAAGVSDALVVEPSASRRAVSAAVGLRTLAPIELGELDASAVIECSGAQSGFDLAIAACGDHARLALVGIHGGNRSIDLVRVLERQITMIGVVSYDFQQDFVLAARLIAEGAVDPTPLVGTSIALGGVPAHLELLADGGLDIVKLMVDPRRQSGEHA